LSRVNLQWPNHPRIYEINTWPWLTRLTEIFGHEIKLNNIPIELIDQEFSNFDAIWTMGVWERSPRSRDIALQDEGLQKEFKKALRYFNTNDVVGSPYAIYYYHVDSHLGGLEGFSKFRTDLQKRGILIILDYVPNHVAIDHLWTLEKSDVFVKGTTNDLITKPFDFFSVGKAVYAHGKDPNFPPWTDTVQINAFSKEAREKAIKTVLSIAEHCDGVRCDMAMLMTNEIFSRTWGDRVGSAPEKEFWEEIIPAVKRKFPNFKFIAEVYWDMEYSLQQQGFDFCYDKRLYERLVNDDAQKVKDHLKGDWAYEKKLLRFIENHDEPRAVTVFGEEASKAAATIVLSLPGARLIYDNQMHGYEIMVPIQLGRGPIEEDKTDITIFYDNLLKAIPGREFNESSWDFCEVSPIEPGDSSYNNIISYIWKNNSDILMIVVNYSLIRSKAHIKINSFNYEPGDWIFEDLLAHKKYVYQSKNLNEYGLFVELSPWQSHIFKIEKK
jgi:hypothetical protein